MMKKLIVKQSKTQKRCLLIEQIAPKIERELTNISVETAKIVAR
jgi:hypothetical protein